MSPDNGLSRRDFLKAAAVAFGAVALRGLPGCVAGDIQPITTSSTEPPKPQGETPKVKPDTAASSQTTPATVEPSETATSTILKKESCGVNTEQMAQRFFNEGIENYNSAPLVTMTGIESVAGKDNAQGLAQEIVRSIKLTAKELSSNGVKAIAIPKFAEEVAKDYENSDVSISVISAEEGVIAPVPENYTSIEAKAFKQGGWGTFVKGPDGFWKTILPKEDATLDKWLMFPEGDIYFGVLPAQEAWGQLEWVKIDGCSWTAAQVNEEGKVTAVMNSNTKANEKDKIWMVNPKVESTQKVEVRNLAESESKFYDPEFVLRMEMEYKGIKMPLTVGLMKSLVERAKEPIKSVVLNDPTKLVDIAELWIKVGLENYKRYNPGNDNLTLDQYVDLVKDGGGLMTVAGISEKDAKSQKDPVVEDLKFSPTKGFVVLMADDNDEFPLLLQPDPNQSAYFGVNENGGLVIASQFTSVNSMVDQRQYEGKEPGGYTVEEALNMMFGYEVARAAMYPIYGKNKCLVAASKTQYRNGGADCGFFGNDAKDFQKGQFHDAIYLKKWYYSGIPLFKFSQK